MLKNLLRRYNFLDKFRKKSLADKKTLNFIWRVSFLNYLCSVLEAKIVLSFNQKTKMKKLVFVFAVVASASLFSCGNADKNEAEATDSTEVAVEEVAEVDTINAATDSAAVVADTTVVVAE